MNTAAEMTNYISFEKDYVFKCEVNGTPLMAAIKGEYDLSEHFGYRVHFSDGFKALFVATETGWQLDGGGGKIYIDAAARELNRFIAVQLKL